MKSFSYVINDELGLHARPAGMLAKEAREIRAARSQSPKREKPFPLPS